MEWIIPGTVLTAQSEDVPIIQQQVQGMFLGGGMMLSQVAAVTGLEPYMIQNWVKRGFLSKPKNKRYDLQQLCRIFVINMLKSALSLEQICSLLVYINGDLQSELDDIISDSDLYFLFLTLWSHHRQMQNSQGQDSYLRALLQSCPEKNPGANQRLENVLRIMLAALASSQLQQNAQQMLTQLKLSQ